MLTHRRVHHHGPLVSALVLQLFARLACGPHDHGLRSTVSASFRAPWWGQDRGFPHGYGCSVGAQPLAFHQQCCGSHRCHDSGASERYVALCARSWWIVVFGGGIEALSCSSRAFSASSAARCCRHLSRHTGQTPSRPSRGAGGGSVGILRPVPLGVHPPFPRNAGDGGTGILCAVPWGVLIPFPRGAGNCSTGVLQPGPWSVLPPPSLSGCD